MKLERHKRLLIVGTVPYNEKSSSRAFDSYFHNWESENIAQIFSNAKTPPKGHCDTLFQITDLRLLKKRWQKDIETGEIYYRENLPDAWENDNLEVDKKAAGLYKLGSHKLSIVYIARKVIWKKKYWCSEKLNKWLDDFNPECVFLSFSDDFFILEIAEYVADRYNIPIVSSIGDDYYFNYSFSLSPFYHYYKLKYRKTVRRVLSKHKDAIYIGDKIRDKYNESFGMRGKTVYLSSTIQRRPFKPIDTINPKISYFGNIRLGRNKSLCDIADALSKINSNYKIDVYSNENERSIYKMLEKNKNINYRGAIPYSQVQKQTVESDVLLVVEGFEKKDVNISKYSLSTKVADSLAAGVSVFAYGSIDCGAIEYSKDTKCIVTCSSKESLQKMLESLIFDTDLQKRQYEKSIEVVETNHRIENSNKIFESVVEESCKEKQ